jgi:hypothetical protein
MPDMGVVTKRKNFRQEDEHFAEFLLQAIRKTMLKGD